MRHVIILWNLVIAGAIERELKKVAIAIAFLKQISRIFSQLLFHKTTNSEIHVKWDNVGKWKIMCWKIILANCY